MSVILWIIGLSVLSTVAYGVYSGFATDAKINQIVTTQCNAHKVTVARRIMRSVHKDEYGVEHSDAEREIAYFIENVIIPELVNGGVAQFDANALYTKVSTTLQRVTTADDMALAISPGFRDDMSGEEYEQFVAGLLQESGWSVTGTATTGDQGVDLIAERDGIRAAIQCKRFTGMVGNGAVQEIVAGAQHYGCTEAWVVTNSKFSQSAMKLAASNGVVLLNHDQLAAL